MKSDIDYDMDRKEKLRIMKENMKDTIDMQREILDSVSCGVFAYTLPEHEMIIINDAAKRIIGCSDDETASEDIKFFLLNCVIPEDRERVFSISGSLKAPGDVINMRYTAVVNENRICVQETIKLLQFINGQKYILCTMLDVTEQIILTDNLTREKKAYRDAITMGCEFSFLFDVSEGMLHERFVTAHGFDIIKEMGFDVPVSFDALLAKYVEESGIEFTEESMRKNFTCKGVIEAAESGITNLVTEYYNAASDMFFRVNCLLSRDDVTGHYLASVVADDVTAIRKKEKKQNEALRAANEEINVRIDAVLSGIVGGLKIIDIDDGYKYCFISEGAARLQGYTVNEFLEKFGNNVTKNIYEEDRETALAAAAEFLKNDSTYSVKYRIVHKDGSIKWVIDNGKFVEDAATGRKYYYILMQDVTELEERNFQISNVLSMQQQMADSLGSGIFAYTIPDYDVLILNQEAKRMFGFNDPDNSKFADEMIGRIVQDDLPIIREAEKRLVNIGDNAEYIFHSVNSDGELNTFKCFTKLLSFSDGEKYILSSLTDITAQELMERRLDEERRQYRNALAYGSDCIFTVDLTENVVNSNVMTKDGVYLFDSFGVSLPSSYDEVASKWFSLDRIITTYPYIEELQSRERLIELCQKGDSLLEINYYVPSDGRYIHILILLYKLDGHINTSFIIYDDTEVKHEQNQRIAIIDSLGNMYSALYHVSFRRDKLTVLKANDDILQDIHISHNYSDFCEMYVSKYVHPDFREAMAAFLDPENIKKALRTSDYVSIEFKRTNFGWCRVNLVAAERDDDGSVRSMVFAGNVIDKQKQAELAQREALKAACESANIANSAKTDFLANMSHDIRTPMNAIIGMTAIAGTHLDDTERVADCLSKINISSKHLLGLINEVLDMSKIESGKMELQEEEFNLPELIDNLLTMSKPQIAEKGHELSVAIRNIEHENVIGDSQRIQQVFMNLMSNAIKYTPDGGKIGLHIGEKSTNKQNVGCYEFVFTDNGIGMSKEYLDHFFEPFVRAEDDERVEKIQGTGLGMPITKNIVQMMNGTINVESELNKGTKITVNIFIKLRNENEVIDYDRFVDLPVLVADDDEMSCIYTCELLEEIGMKGEWVLTGEEALRKTEERHAAGDDYFAVILDWKMPGMNGVETTREIRKRFGKDIPIVIISAYDWSEIEQEARAAGANAFISKPLFKSRVIHLFNDLAGGEKEKTGSDLNMFKDEDFTGKRALLVEDNELNAEIATEILESTGLTVETAVNGKEAVDIMTSVEENYFDIIFMDIQMPIMNGYEAARAIRALPRDYTRSIPILAMTANAFAEDVAAVKNVGMNEHIAKPLDFAHLLDSLKKWLG